MTELTIDQSEDVAGGLSFLSAVSGVRTIVQGVQGYVSAMSAIGGTLSNYYGAEMTISIVAAGNMTA